MERIKDRNNPVEIFYYAMRCLWNRDKALECDEKEQAAKFLKLADELGAMLPKEAA